MAINMNSKQSNSIYSLFAAMLIAALPCFQLIAHKHGEETVCLSLIIVLLLLLLLYSRLSDKIHRIELSKSDICFCLVMIVVLIRGLCQSSTIEPIVALRCFMVTLLWIALKLVHNKNILIVSIVIATNIEIFVAGLQFAGIIDSYNPYFHMTGSFSNPGPWGCFLSIGIISAIILSLKLFERHKALFFLVVVDILFLSVALYLSDSRTGWLSLFVGSIYLVHYAEGANLLVAKIRKILPVIFLLAVPTFILLWNYKEDSANGRLLIWGITGEMILKSPVTGIGIGEFQSNYMFAQANHFKGTPNSTYKMVADNVHYPFNEYLGISVEIGLFAMLFVMTGIYYLFTNKSDSSSFHYRSMLLAWLIIAGFSYPSESISLLFIFPALCVSSDNSVRWIFTTSKWIGISHTVCILCAICVSAFVFLAINRDDYIIYRKKDMANKAWQIVDENDFSKIDTVVKSAERYPSSEIFCAIGEQYMRNRHDSLAMYYFKLASNMVPSRLYPKYCLYRLSLQQNAIDMAEKQAISILGTPVKYENTRTLKIKSELRDFLSNHRYSCNEATSYGGEGH